MAAWTILTTFSASVARSVALSDVAALLMAKCEAWYSASQARKAAATVSQYCCVAGSMACGARWLAYWTGVCGFAAAFLGCGLHGFGCSGKKSALGAFLARL